MKTFQVEFRLWFWNYVLSPFSWSKWTDVLTFEYAGAYLPQGRVNKRTNAKKFRIVSMNSSFSSVNPRSVGLDKLTECRLIDNQVKHPTDAANNPL